MFIIDLLLEFVFWAALFGGVGLISAGLYKLSSRFRRSCLGGPDEKDWNAKVRRDL